MVKQYVKTNIIDLKSLLDHLYEDNEFSFDGTVTQYSYLTPDFKNEIGNIGGYRSIDGIYNIMKTNNPNYTIDKYKQEILNLKDYHLQICLNIKNVTFFKNEEFSYSIDKLKQETSMYTEEPFWFAINKLQEYKL